MIEQKRGLNMAEACTYIGGISRNGMYKLMGDREISSYLIGARRYFLRDSLDAYLNQQIQKEIETTM